MVSSVLRKTGSSIAAFGVAALPAAGLTAAARPAGAHPAPQHGHQAFVKYTILEQFGVTATEVRLEWTWSQNEVAVWSPAWIDNIDLSYCGHSAFPDWDIRSCAATAYKRESTGDRHYVQATIWGDFDHLTGPSYEMAATAQQNNGLSGSSGDYLIECWLSRGSLPPLWSPQCSGEYID